MKDFVSSRRLVCPRDKSRALMINFVPSLRLVRSHVILPSRRLAHLRDNFRVLMTTLALTVTCVSSRRTDHPHSLTCHHTDARTTMCKLILPRAPSRQYTNLSRCNTVTIMGPESTTLSHLHYQTPDNTHTFTGQHTPT